MAIGGVSTGKGSTDANLSTVKTKSRVYTPAKTTRQDEQFAQLTEVGIVY